MTVDLIAMLKLQYLLSMRRLLQTAHIKSVTAMMTFISEYGPIYRKGLSAYPVNYSPALNDGGLTPRQGVRRSTERAWTSEYFGQFMWAQVGFRTTYF